MKVYDKLDEIKKENIAAVSPGFKPDDLRELSDFFSHDKKK